MARTAVRLRGAGREEATRRRPGRPWRASDRATTSYAGPPAGCPAANSSVPPSPGPARPRVLVCDEITSGLDPVTRRSPLDLLAVPIRQRDGLCVVLITHDLDTAAPATRIAVLDGGEVVEQGDSDRILTAPEHPFTVSLLRASTRWGAAVRP
ncbi:hypothetical protein ACFWVP_25715 [Streptomyces sp. NPDC058637]|uniref:hypothetical protein n=1 Tax=Streptomyces sp. NPDC058637 TaxID=3346569 RepID=UPI00364AAD91